MRYFLGIDIGTQGARIAVTDISGNQVISGEETFKLTEDSRQEQSPESWWTSCRSLIQKKLNDDVKNNIESIAVTSTSGTVIPLDKENNPLHPALMYSDKRSAIQGRRCMQAAQENTEGYTGFNASSGLSKMVWFAENHPEKTARIVRWVHAADYITGKLSGVWGVTDHTNALKSGYDTRNGIWPEYLFSELGLSRTWMPEVHPSGTVIGTMSPEVSQTLGFKNRPKVTVGITDGCASQIASGAIYPGTWNTTIGTTLVVKGVTQEQMIDPEGRFYSHRHPQGYWMPGGAGNIGADWVSRDFGNELSLLEKEAANNIPTGRMSFPLVQKGERFPFMAPEAVGFRPDNIPEAVLYASNMEGVAFVERMAYTLAQKLSRENIEAVYTAGGGSNSPLWLKIRSSVLNLPVYKMKHTSGAFGAAVLAASQTFFDNLTEAGKELIRMEKEVLPDTGLNKVYEGQYEKFLRLLETKNYIKQEDYA
ncbi:FGGY-family carbohydrate kinase [Sinomicrobium kalidii]|uniref:FGGY-family carbohydrate kinase n=1 Tax=Sinomicrobium kalidii TaxID=2900738 RepID=UPI001E45DE83|nr:FGGY-family carbohydrate kinase [Sinomicrobium kalidii]UGU17653.1 FGGY-family carbohydrate kinase [Sinomicrobium kalidii]